MASEDLEYSEWTNSSTLMVLLCPFLKQTAQSKQMLCSTEEKYRFGWVKNVMTLIIIHDYTIKVK